MLYYIYIALKCFCEVVKRCYIKCIDTLVHMHNDVHTYMQRIRFTVNLHDGSLQCIICTLQCVIEHLHCSTLPFVMVHVSYSAVPQIDCCIV